MDHDEDHAGHSTISSSRRPGRVHERHSQPQEVGRRRRRGCARGCREGLGVVTSRSIVRECSTTYMIAHISVACLSVSTRINQLERRPRKWSCQRRGLIGQGACAADCNELCRIADSHGVMAPNMRKRAVPLTFTPTIRSESWPASPPPSSARSPSCRAHARMRWARRT